MTELDKWYAFRQQMIEVLAADLMGNAAEHTLDEPPLDRFVLGILHPQAMSMDEERSDDDDGSDGGRPDAAYDPAVALAHMRKPASAGMTFAVDASATPEIDVQVGVARFVKGAQSEPAFESGEGRANEHARASEWIREEIVPDTVRIDTTVPVTRSIGLVDGLDLYVVVRKPRGFETAITLVLVNTNRSPTSGASDPYCWFQPTMTVRALSGMFVPRRSDTPIGVEDRDLRSYELLFRHVQDLATGHGCSVEWGHGEDVAELHMTFLPAYDVKLAEPAGGSGLTVRMADAARDLSLIPLRDLVSDYRVWIDERSAEVPDLPEDLQATARRHLDEAAEAARRIERGVDLLERDTTAAHAFRLMNKAMELQRSRQDAMRGAEPRTQTWRPFQLAFILLNLEGLTDSQSPERELADLLWFPTGGGKTEAYLGLIGYAILLRRLRDRSDGGVSVIMRYTLRLLTVQQFERAAGLICALESIRKKEISDSAPISLGLWVGQAATPNSVKDARSAIKAIKQGDTPKNGNPMQLVRCPVCGSPIDEDQYRFESHPDRMLVRCSDATCEYGYGLPVHLVDEDVYRERPSLVIGTVDKFAMMAWREQVRNLFSRDGENSPPDLIVQDELHLISGPLGTMVGLYEAAVDAACTGAARPKVVASTATIRRASEQVRAVFDRESRQFPPSGLDSIDSYFSREASAESKGTRRYLGIAAPGVSQTTLMVRAYAALLQAAAQIEGDDEVRDTYWTLLSYFNSLRVLGGAYMQVLDDIPDRLKVIARRMGVEPRALGEPGELTSRVDSSEIPHSLALLGTSYPAPETQDVVLATNMISVGVDVDRLGLMGVMGQPQTTAEYIQSTSRVGRQRPGLVVVLYNAARSRDLSHYEGFGAYHRALYRQVEATGATPFAARARDRGLHGVVVAMARLLVDGLAGDSAAVRLPKHRQELDSALAMLRERAERIAPEAAPALERQLSDLLEHWTQATQSGALAYPAWGPKTDGALLADASRAVSEQVQAFPVSDPAWPTMTSLRDVDATSGLYLVHSTPKEA